MPGFAITILILSILIVLKMKSACVLCCMYANALPTTFTMEANTMSPDQTAIVRNISHQSKFKKLI